MAQLAQDTGAGSATTSGWGTGSDGNAWTTQAGSPANGIIRDGSGHLTISNSSASAFCTYTALTPTNTEILVRVTSDNGQGPFGVIFRWQNTSNHYLVRYDGNASFVFMRKVSNSYSTLVSSAFTPANNTKYWIRVQNIGTAVKARIWQDGSAEPSTWAINTTDNTYTSGKFGLYGFSFSTTLYDSYTVTDGSSSNQLRSRAIAEYAVHATQTTRAQSYFSTYIKERTRASAQFKVRSGLRGRGITGFKVKAGLRGRNETAFRVRTGLSTETQSRYATRIPARTRTTARFSLRLALQSRAIARWNLRASLLARSISHFVLGRRFLTPIYTRFVIRPQLTSRGVARNQIRTAGRTRGVAQAALRISLRARAAAAFIARIGARTRGISRFQVSHDLISLVSRAISSFKVLQSRLSAEKTAFSLFQALNSAFSAQQLLQASFASENLIFTAFSEIQPVPEPNSDIESVVTVTNKAGAAVTNCSPVTCTVTFPDKTTSNYSLGSGITNNGDGTYTLTYTTKGPGIHVEDWVITDSNGKVTKPRNKVPVSY